MTSKERAGIKLLKRIKNDYVFRAFIFSALSFFITMLFTAYNVFLCIAYKAVKSFLLLIKPVINWLLVKNDRNL